MIYFETGRFPLIIVAKIKRFVIGQNLQSKLSVILYEIMHNIYQANIKFKWLSHVKGI